jgi:hypothetical protein
MRQKVKVRLVLVPGVSGVAISSHRGGPSVRKYIAVSVEEVCNPGLGHLNMGHCAYKILDHLPCRRKVALCKPNDVLYKVILLLWCDLTLPDVLSVDIHLNTPVTARQSCATTMRIFCNSAIRHFFARL